MQFETLKLRHIAKAMGLTDDEVLVLAADPRKAFKRPEMRPVGAKMRLITAVKRRWKLPYNRLASLLQTEFGSHPAAHGSVPGRSPFTAASRHLGVRNLLSRDVKDAFPSVKADRFYLEMLALGFDTEMACLLTKLLLPDGYIPQGGPTSNAAIELFFRRIDDDICRDLAALGARYTRFTDGLDASFRNTRLADDVALIFDRHLARLGLSINQRKVEKNGWQPIGVERVICGVRVNSPHGTQLPRSVTKQLIADCERLYWGARSVAPHTLVGLAKRRRALQGWLNQASQADIAPVGDLQRRVHQADMLIRQALHRARIHPNRQWYVKGRNFDEPAHLAALWRSRRALSAAA